MSLAAALCARVRRVCALLPRRRLCWLCAVCALTPAYVPRTGLSFLPLVYLITFRVRRFFNYFWAGLSRCRCRLLPHMPHARTHMHAHTHTHAHTHAHAHATHATVPVACTDACAPAINPKQKPEPNLETPHSTGNMCGHICAGGGRASSRRPRAYGSCMPADGLGKRFRV